MAERGAHSVKSWTSGRMGCSVAWAGTYVGYTRLYTRFLKRRYTIDRPGRWPTATTFAKSAEIIVSPQRVFIRPMPAHRLTLISTFWLPPPFSLRASLRAFPPTVFSPSHLLFFNVRADRGRDVSCVEPTWFGKKKKKKRKKELVLNF